MVGKCKCVQFYDIPINPGNKRLNRSVVRCCFFVNLIIKNYEPNFSCTHERRVGGNGNGDGPKWVCDPHRITRVSREREEKNHNNSTTAGCVVYSIGSRCKFEFELGMQRAVGVGTCEYHTFDMGDYQKCAPSELKNSHYHQWGIKKQEDNGDKHVTPGNSNLKSC